jgi:integrase
MVEPIKSKTKVKEILTTLREQDFRNYMLVKVGLNSALRISDLLKLKYSSFFDDDGTLKPHFHVQEQKTGKGRNIPTDRFGDDLLAYVKNYGLSGDDFIFFNKWNPAEAIKPCNAWVLMNKIGKAHGVRNVGTHTLRKTWAYHYYRDTGDLRIVMRVLNHSSIPQTLAYLGIVQEDIDEAFEKHGF